MKCHKGFDHCLIKCSSLSTSARVAIEFGLYFSSFLQVVAPFHPSKMLRIAIYVVGILEGRRCHFFLNYFGWNGMGRTYYLDGGFKYFLFSSLFGEDSQFD